MYYAYYYYSSNLIDLLIQAQVHHKPKTGPKCTAVTQITVSVVGLFY